MLMHRGGLLEQCGHVWDGMGDDPNELCVAAFQATFAGQFKDPRGLGAFFGVIEGHIEAPGGNK